MKITTLRSYITLVVTTIVTFMLLFLGFFFYARTTAVLTSDYEQQLTARLGRATSQISTQMKSIDSVYGMFLSNTLIRETLDPVLKDSPVTSSDIIQVEKQMSYLLYNSYAWDEKLIHAVYLFDGNGHCFQVMNGKNPLEEFSRNKEIMDYVDRSEPYLMMKTREDDDEILYFIRNIFSTVTGEYTATMVLNISQSAWMDSYSRDMDTEWLVYLYNNELNVTNRRDMVPFLKELQPVIPVKNQELFLDELDIEKEAYFVAAEKISNTNLVSFVAAPTAQLTESLQMVLRPFIFFLCVLTAAAVFLSIMISRAVTQPINKMIGHVKEIAGGKKGEMPPMTMFGEFNEFSQAFNQMLAQLEASYQDNLEKQLLLKNSEIRSLQSQMDPHFLFNVLNIIAWKAQMSGDEEVYQMVISLGELLRRNTLSREKDFITLSNEMEYAKLYIYLQKMRFEEKLNVEMQIADGLTECLIPSMSIQPLIENAIVHGLEPKKGMGRLEIVVTAENGGIRVSIRDDGIGFAEIPDIGSIASSMEDSHTHIGLKNLNRRLLLLYGEHSGLKISSTPGRETVVTFWIPPEREENDAV